MKYTRYDLFLICFVGLLGGSLLGIFITLISSKQFERSLSLFAVIGPLLVGVVTVIYQMERQHKENYHLQISNHKEELMQKVYEEISKYISCSMQKYSEAQILINSINRQYHNCIICKDPTRNPEPKIYTKHSEVDGTHSQMVHSLTKLMNKLEEYDIVGKNIEIFRIALASAVHLIVDTYLNYQEQIFPYLPCDIKKERQEQLGVNLSFVKTPTHEDAELIDQEFESYSEALLDGYCFVSDLSREAQNVLLGNLFDNQVLPRTPTDYRYVVVTTRTADVMKLKLYFTEKDRNGLTQYQKDFKDRVKMRSAEAKKMINN
ncbi:MAG: hypothetical protein ABFD79_09610 [Phycisphaerales bacterium]